MFRRTFVLLLGALGFGGVTPDSAQAQSAEQFYRGKTVTMVVPTSAGGNFDLNARLVARHLGRFIPGQPAVVVQNMPGAGGLVLANEFMNTRERDGLTIGIMERGAPQMPYEGDKNARYDPLKFTWLGSTSSYADDAYLLLVNRDHPAKTIDDLRGSATGIVARLGGDTPGSSNLTFAILARDLMKLNVKVVRGYAGAARMFIAMQSGELDGQVIGLGSVRIGQPALWNSGMVRPLLAFGHKERLPALPDVPTAREYLSAPDDLALMQFAELQLSIALPFLAPPDIPAERARALRDAFMATVRDPAFLEDARKANFQLSPIDSDAVYDVIRKMAATPKDVIQRYVSIVRAIGD